LILVIPKKNGKFRICVDFIKLNATTKQDPFPLPFIDEVLNTMAWCVAYSFWMDILDSSNFKSTKG
jgi:hypothetical protein